MDGQFGVKESKEFLDLGFAVAQAGKCVMEDGKATIGDIACVIPIFPKVAPGLDNIGIALQEMAELGENDEKELLDYTKSKLNETISDARARELMYVWLRAGLAVAHAYHVTKA